MISGSAGKGREATQINSNYDLLICGASFAGLATAWEVTRNLKRERTGGISALIIDRYDIGERQTSACAAPTGWIDALGCEGTIRQSFDQLIVNTALGTNTITLPFTFSTFDYRSLCETLASDADIPFEMATVKGRTGNTVHTDRGDISAKMIIDCMGWRGALRKNPVQPPKAPLSRGLEVSPKGTGDKLEIWIDRSLAPAGYSWCFPADDELRVGVGSFDPYFHVRQPTRRLARMLGVEEANYQGGWIPHRFNTATEDGIFFVGDSAGQCLPLTAEGIRTAFYFGLACAREVSRVFHGSSDVETALLRYQEFCDRHEYAWKWMLRVQRLIPRLHPRLLQSSISTTAHLKFSRWAFGHYLKIAHPSFAWTADVNLRTSDRESRRLQTRQVI